jgi:glycosyltransferase involved in cell wall biosynthesis
LPDVVGHVPLYEMVENGVDLARFSALPRRAPVDPSRARFAFVGRLVDWKGVDLLLEALAALQSRVRVELELFGDGVERGALEARASALGLTERVHFHGFLPQAEIACRLAELDGLVLPSVYECGGAVVLEAMAMRLPVIATRWGGPEDYLDPSCGILIAPDSRASMVHELAQAMQRLAEDAPLRQALGRAGRRKVEREFDWERKVDRMLEIYQATLAADRQTSAQTRYGSRSKLATA